MIVRFLFAVLVLFFIVIPNDVEGYYRRRRRCSPTNCRVSTWGSWGACSHPCGSRGLKTRTRTKVRAESCGGKCLYPLTETTSCNRGCSNGGTPLYYGGYCRCRPGFSGQCCEKGCMEGHTIINKCKERCQCQQGKYKCTRIRKEFTSMTTDERKKYINAVKVASTDKRYKADYDRLLTTHRTLFDSNIHERDNFLPWHRWFLLQYENLLRRVDCTVTATYWDWSVVTRTAWRGLRQDFWYAGYIASGFGGNGDCVKTGPFRESMWSLVPSADSVCLARDFNGFPPDSISVQLVLSNAWYQFEEFETALRVNLHDTVHCLIGGTMCSQDSASAPEFFAHHAFIDKIWADWQAKGYGHKNAHFPNLAAPMVGTSLRPRDLIDLNRQPGGVSVEYSPLPKAVQPNIRGRSASFLKSIPRQKFSCLIDRALKLFRVKADEIKKARAMAKKLEPAVTLSASTPLSGRERSLGYRDPQ